MYNELPDINSLPILSIEKTAVEVIDLTPTWESILPFLLESAAEGNQDSIEELKRMAKIADAYAAMMKKIS